MNQTPKYEHIPRATIQRLATYLQVLEAMDKDGVQVISSEPLSRACDVNASQVRKDLAYFGEFGVRGVGYYVSYLLEVIKACLNANREWRACLVGVGNMGRALLNYSEFRRHGFTIVGAFDCDPFKIGEKISIRRFVRYEMGEGLEKRVNDLAAEVAEQTAKMGL